MKVVIVCGGKGTRLREETEFKPKPMVEIGGLPILVHIMQHYSHFGHTEFILCLGYKGNHIKDYFLNLSRYANDFSLDLKTGETEVLSKVNQFPFKITFAETGEDSPTGYRIRQAMKYIPDREFLLTYGDGVSDIDINKSIRFHHSQTKKFGTIVTISGVRPSSKYGKIYTNGSNIIEKFDEKPKLNDYINGGFMVINRRISRFINDTDMIEDTLVKLTKKGMLSRYKHDGFWHSMDTMKDVIDLNNIWQNSKQWALWEKRK